MNLINYLEEYREISFKEVAFNEIDALALADFSYVDFTELGIDKERISAEDLLEYLDNYEPKPTDSERKLNYLEVARLLCESERYEKLEFAHFRKVKDLDSDKQFQAVTILFKDTMYISFCGTDSTTVGWKEDLNMAILDLVPSEIEAMKYANMSLILTYWIPQFVFVAIYVLRPILAVCISVNPTLIMFCFDNKDTFFRKIDMIHLRGPFMNRKNNVIDDVTTTFSSNAFEHSRDCSFASFTASICDIRDANNNNNREDYYDDDDINNN